MKETVCSVSFPGSGNRRVANSLFNLDDSIIKSDEQFFLLSTSDKSNKLFFLRIVRSMLDKISKFDACLSVSEKRPTSLSLDWDAEASFDFD